MIFSFLYDTSPSSEFSSSEVASGICPMLHEAGDALASVMLAAVCFVSRSSEGSLCYVLTSFSHSLICLESWKTDPLGIKAQRFPDKLAGRSPQGKGEQGRGGRCRIPTLCVCTEPGLTIPDPSNPSTDNKLAERGLWPHICCRIGSYLGTTI